MQHNMAASIMCELMHSMHTLHSHFGSFPIGNVEERNVKVWHQHKGNRHTFVSSLRTNLMASMCVLALAEFRQQNYFAKFRGQTHLTAPSYQYADRNCNSADAEDKKEANFSLRKNKTNSFSAPRTFCFSLSPERHC